MSDSTDISLQLTANAVNEQ